MSLRTLLGPGQPLLSETAEAAELLTLPSFFMYPSGVDNLRQSGTAPWPVSLDATFRSTTGPTACAGRSTAWSPEATAAVEDGAGTLIIDGGAAGPDRAPVPSRLPSARSTRRWPSAACARRAPWWWWPTTCSTCTASRCCWATAPTPSPRLALATVAAEADRADDGDLTSPEAQPLPGRGRGRRAQDPVEDGHQHRRLVPGRPDLRGGGPRPRWSTCFTGSPNQVGGVGWRALGEDVLAGTPRPGATRPTWCRPASSVRKGEPHAKDKDTVQALNDLTLVQETGDDGQDRDMLVAHLLQAAIRSESSERYDAFAKLANDRALVELHDLLELPRPASPSPSTRSSR